MDTARMNIKSGKSQIESEEVDREIELSPSKTPMSVPFEREFPHEILTLIISYANRNGLAACLRVSKQFFHIAGERLYARIEIGRETGWNELMRGAVPYGFSEEETDRHKTSQATSINYKRQLLEYVETFAIGEHCCPPKGSSVINSSAKAYGMMPRLQRVISPPGADCEPTACYSGFDDLECTIYHLCMSANLLQYKSLIIHDSGLDTLLHGRLEPFTEMLDTVQHATLVISPTLTSSKDFGPKGNERNRTPLKLESLRLIFADDKFNTNKVTAPDALVSADCLPKSVAPYLTLANWKIEIYIFNDFDNTLDLVDFREKLKIEVDDAIKAMPEKERPAWTPNYQVFGLEDYFNHPDMYLELDHEWMMSWRMELDRRQRAQREEDKRIAGIEKVTDLAELPCTDNR